MIKLLAAAAILAVVFMSATAHANELDDCWRVKDDDSRYYCESVYEGKPHCWRIKNDDRRYMCDALKGKQNVCWRIKNNDYRNMCKAQTGQ